MVMGAEEKFNFINRNVKTIFNEPIALAESDSEDEHSKLSKLKLFWSSTTGVLRLSLLGLSFPEGVGG